MLAVPAGLASGNQAMAITVAVVDALLFAAFILLISRRKRLEVEKREAMRIALLHSKIVQGDSESLRVVFEDIHRALDLMND